MLKYIGMSKKLFKRTKILATVGPACFSEEKLREMVYAGVNGFRLNFSHGTYDERDEQIRIIRKYAEERGRNVAILQDIQGPKIRFGDLKDDRYDFKKGDEVLLDYAVKDHDGGTSLPVQWNLAQYCKEGEPISFFDGKVKGVIIEISSDTAIKVKILNDGYITSHKGINLPDTDLGGDIITEKDKADLEFGASRDFDYVAVSFIQKPEDIEKVRQILVSNGSHAKIIAKIETKKAIETDENLEAIVMAADGVMVARGDLAIEAGYEVVPIVQRKLLAFARQNAKLVIVATQMLGSMVDNPEPNRAEVNDVATAVVMGADVTMLSDESASGKYPIESIRTMKKIILYTQDHARMQPIENDVTGTYKNYDAIAAGAVKIAEDIDADLLVVATHTGETANAIAAVRPNMPIVSVTDDKRVAGQLALRYANTAYVREFDQNSAIDTVKDLKTEGYLKLPEGQEELTVVLVQGYKNEEGSTNMIQIRKI